MIWLQQSSMTDFANVQRVDLKQIPNNEIELCVSSLHMSSLGKRIFNSFDVEM